MRRNLAGIVYALFLVACSDTSEVTPTGNTDASDSVDICDLRAVFGTCRAYDLSKLDDWYAGYVEKTCADNRRGDFAGVYVKKSSCPSENRVARCDSIVEDSAEHYEYDKHYYEGTADGFSWKRGDIQVSCNSMSGRFVPD